MICVSDLVGNYCKDKIGLQITVANVQEAIGEGNGPVSGALNRMEQDGYLKRITYRGVDDAPRSSWEILPKARFWQPKNRERPVRAKIDGEAFSQGYTNMAREYIKTKPGKIVTSSSIAKACGVSPSKMWSPMATLLREGLLELISTGVPKQYRIVGGDVAQSAVVQSTVADKKDPGARSTYLTLAKEQLDKVLQAKILTGEIRVRLEIVQEQLDKL